MSTATKEKPKAAKAPAKAKAKTAKKEGTITPVKQKPTSKGDRRGKENWDIPLHRIKVQEDFNKRSEATYGDIEAFADVIQSDGGQIVPAIGFKDKDGKWVLTAGHRRFAALHLIAERTGKEPTMMIMKGPKDDISRLLIQYKENVKEPNSEMDKALIVDGLIQRGLKPKDIEKKLGISQSVISNLRTILEMPEEVKTAIKDKKISGASALKASRLLKDKGEKLAKAVGKMTQKAEAQGKKKATDRDSDLEGMRSVGGTLKATIDRLEAKKEKMGEIDANETFALALLQAVKAGSSDKAITALILSGGK